jgi:hypothetical protein
MRITASDYLFTSLMSLKDKVLENMAAGDKDKKGDDRGSTVTTNAARKTGAGAIPPMSGPGIQIEEVKEGPGRMIRPKERSMLESIHEEEKKEIEFQFDKESPMR